MKKTQESFQPSRLKKLRPRDISIGLTKANSYASGYKCGSPVVWQTIMKIFLEMKLVGIENKYREQ